MGEIKIEKKSDSELNEMGVFSWPVWEKETSRFDWHYDSDEACYILEGEVTVIPKEGKEAVISAGDFVTFPKGMDCVWNIKKDIRKHYSFS
ncbi:MAG: cupin domain-containing protein [Candidatus Aureabacteria bacterium]|nr:cupin domain-containing protein [Candidatus Auribacterota bacterium]